MRKQIRAATILALTIGFLVLGWMKFAPRYVPSSQSLPATWAEQGTIDDILVRWAQQEKYGRHYSTAKYFVWSRNKDKLQIAFDDPDVKPDNWCNDQECLKKNVIEFDMKQVPIGYTLIADRLEAIPDPPSSLPGVRRTGFSAVRFRWIVASKKFLFWRL